VPAAVKFLPGHGHRVVGAFANGIIKIWDVQTGTVLLTFQPQGIEVDGISIDVSRDGRFLVGLADLRPSQMSVLCMWSLENNGALMWSVPNLPIDGSGPRFSPDSTTIFMTRRVPPTQDPFENLNKMFIYNAMTGEHVFTFPIHGSAPLEDMAFSPDGALLLVVYDGCADIYDVSAAHFGNRLTSSIEGNEFLGEGYFPFQAQIVKSVAFYPTEYVQRHHPTNTYAFVMGTLGDLFEYVW
jgi:WD40 repeat protein